MARSPSLFATCHYERHQCVSPWKRPCLSLQAACNVRDGCIYAGDFDSTAGRTRIPAAKTSTTSNATVAKDTTTRLTEPPLQRGLLEPAASGAWGGVTAPDVQGQQLPTRPPDRRGTAGEADYDSSLIDASGIACAANARARRRLRRETGRAAANPCSPFPQLDLGRLISRRHAATAIATAAQRRSVRVRLVAVARGLRVQLLELQQRGTAEQTWQSSCSSCTAAAGAQHGSLNRMIAHAA